MATLEIETFSDVASWATRLPLDGQGYTLRCEWNERDGWWYGGLWDEDDAEPILSSVRLVPDFPLFRRVLPGFLWVYAPDGLRGELADMTRQKIFYVDAESAAEARL